MLVSRRAPGHTAQHPIVLLEEYINQQRDSKASAWSVWTNLYCDLTQTNYTQTQRVESPSLPYLN